jgi:hypothetical protein
MRTGFQDYGGAEYWRQLTHTLITCYLGPEPIQMYGGRQPTAKPEVLVTAPQVVDQIGMFPDNIIQRLRDRNVKGFNGWGT